MSNVDWKGMSEEKLFGEFSEQPRSPAYYFRQQEISRRNYVLAKDVAAAQVEALQATKSAMEAQIRAAAASERSAVTAEQAANWTRYSAVAIYLTVIATLLAGYLT